MSQNNSLLNTAKTASWNAWAAYRNYKNNENSEYSYDLWKECSKIADKFWKKAISKSNQDPLIILEANHWSQCLAKRKNSKVNLDFKPLIS